MPSVSVLSRWLIIGSCLFAFVYGVLMMKKHSRPSYFKIAVCGMFAAFLAHLFFQVLSLSDGNTESFCVGTFGHAAVYLFYIVANRAYVPPELEEKNDKSICPIALLGAVLPCGLFAAAAACRNTFGSYVTEAIYMLSMGTAVYFAFRSTRNKYHNPFRKQITPYNLCLCILVYAQAAAELTAACGSDAAVTVCTVITTVIMVPVLCAMLPLLKRGLQPWEI